MPDDAQNSLDVQVINQASDLNPVDIHELTITERITRLEQQTGITN